VSREALLVNWANVRLAPSMTYAENIEPLRRLVLATFRYGVPQDLTGTAVSLGNMRLHTTANIYADERAARQAIAAAKAELAARPRR
jgi:hypothetical protein